MYLKINPIFAVTAFVLVMPIIFSCSSQPKNQGDINQYRVQAEMLLESGNRETGKGNYDNALILIDEGKRLATLADDPSLIIRTSLSRANVIYSLGKTDEAFAEWRQAVAEAEKFGDIELISAAKIYLARGELISKRNSAQSVLDIVSGEQSNIRTNQLYIAVSWQVRGLALRSLGKFKDAEEAFTQSAAIHEKNLFFENASYDWYSIASSRSLSGDFNGAVQALEKSIEIDRRIENSWGLAASWRAMGDVYRKMGNEQKALEAYNRSISIYKAMGNSYEVSQTELKIKEKQ
ncbi:MAG: tetratricopeptide repeat protein [Treponema sp.]|jgi:tetratricopeptide (TPR) repeat protein|nr:tetratricopeptide repeat protein [Treponema sp.]